MVSQTTTSPASRACLRAIGCTPIVSSDVAGWTSVLVDHHAVGPGESVVEVPPTPDQTVVVLVRGEQEIEVLNGGTRRRAVYRPGTVGLTAGGRGDRLRRRVREGTPTEKVNLYLPAATVEEVAEHHRRAGQRAAPAVLQHPGARDPLVLQTVLALVSAAGRGAPDLYGQVAALWLATHLLSGGVGGRAERWSEGRSAGVLTPPRLAAVLETVEERYAEPLSLDDLAAQAGISKFHFGRLFRRAMGTTPHAHLVAVRLDAAADLLTSTDLGVAQVAARCGFASASHFTTVFAARRGSPPTRYRQLHR